MIDSDFGNSLPDLIEIAGKEYSLRRDDSGRNSLGYFSEDGRTTAFGGFHESTRRLVKIQDEPYLLTCAGRDALYSFEGNLLTGRDYLGIEFTFELDDRTHIFAKSPEDNLWNTFALDGSSTNLFGCPHSNYGLILPDGSNGPIITAQNKYDGLWAAYDIEGNMHFGSPHYHISRFEEVNEQYYAICTPDKKDKLPVYFSKEGILFVDEFEIKENFPLISKLNGLGIIDSYLETYRSITNFIENISHLDFEEDDLKASLKGMVRSIMSRQEDLSMMTNELEKAFATIKRKIETGPEDLLYFLRCAA